MTLQILIDVRDSHMPGGIEGIREDIAAYCERFGNVRVAYISEKTPEQINLFGGII